MAQYLCGLGDFPLSIFCRLHDIQNTIILLRSTYIVILRHGLAYLKGKDC